MKLGVLFGVGALSLSVGAAPLLQPVAALEVPHARVVAFSPDGSLLAVAAGRRSFSSSPARGPRQGSSRDTRGRWPIWGSSPGPGTWPAPRGMGPFASGIRGRAVVKTLSVSGGASDILALALSPDEKMVAVGASRRSRSLGSSYGTTLAQGGFCAARSSLWLGKSVLLEGRLKEPSFSGCGRSSSVRMGRFLPPGARIGCSGSGTRPGRPSLPPWRVTQGPCTASRSPPTGRARRRELAGGGRLGRSDLEGGRDPLRPPEPGVGGGLLP